MEGNWIRKDITDENDAIIDLIDDVDMYEYICNDDEDYYMVDPNEWEKAYKDSQKGRNKKEEIRIEHELWERSSKLIQQGYEALRREDIDEAIVLFEESISLKSKSNSPYQELSKIYKKRHETENELRICKIASERLPTLLQYSKRVRELEGTQPEIKKPCKRQKAVIVGPSFGDNFYNLWDSFTEDDFHVRYFYDEEDREEYIYSEPETVENKTDQSCQHDRLAYIELNESKRTELCNYYDYMYNTSKLVKEAVALDDYCLAIDICERLLSEEMPYYDYYESLRGFYQKFRLRDAELVMLKEVMVLVEKDIIRYNKLINKFTSWFPNVDISDIHPYLGHGINISNKGTGQIKKWEERIIWLEDRVSKKARK